MDELIADALRIGKITMADADTILTFVEFLSKAGPPPHRPEDVTPELKVLLSDPEWREFLGLDAARKIGEEPHL